MLRWPLRAVWALGLVTCGPDELAPAELAEVCGVEGPFRLLPLEVDDVLYDELERIGDRYYLRVTHLARTPGASKVVGETLWSVGTCGESPRRLADDVSDIFTDPERWPGVLLGCRRARDETVSFDLTGEEPPHVIFDNSICRGKWTRRGIVDVEGPQEKPTSLVLYPYPDDPRRDAPEPRVLYGPSVIPEDPLDVDRDGTLVIEEDTASFLTREGRLLTVALADGAVTVEQTNVRSFYISPEGRYLLYQDLTVTQDDLYRPRGVVFLRDRTTGEGAALAHDWLNYEGYSLEFTTLGVVTLTLPDDVVRVFFLPELDFVDLPQYLTLRRQIADGRWLMQARWEGGPIYLGDLGDLAATTKLFGNSAVLPTAPSPDGVMVVAGGDCCHEAYFSDQGPAWSVPFDGSPPLRVADRVSRNTVQLDPRRLASAIDIESRTHLAEVVLIDLETSMEQRVDRQVHVPYPGYPPLRPLADDIYQYQVIDGERSGVWLVRLPPADP